MSASPSNITPLSSFIRQTKVTFFEAVTFALAVLNQLFSRSLFSIRRIWFSIASAFSLVTTSLLVQITFCAPLFHHQTCSKFLLLRSLYQKMGSCTLTLLLSKIDWFSESIISYLRLMRNSESADFLQLKTSPLGLELGTLDEGISESHGVRRSSIL